MIARTLGVVDDVKASTSDGVCTCARERRRAMCTCPQRGVGVGIHAGVSARMSDCPVSRDNDKDDAVHGHEHEHGDADGHGCDVGTLITHAHVCVGAQADPTVLDGDSKSQHQCRNQHRNGSDKGNEMWNSGDRSEDRVHACYFAGEGALRLAGEGVFSPAVSGPPSPITPRVPFYVFAPDTLGDAEGNALRRRLQAREDEPGHF